MHPINKLLLEKTIKDLNDVKSAIDLAQTSEQYILDKRSGSNEYAKVLTSIVLLEESVTLINLAILKLKEAMS